MKAKGGGNIEEEKTYQRIHVKTEFTEPTDRSHQRESR